jgi:hypothetical protein
MSSSNESSQEDDEIDFFENTNDNNGIKGEGNDGSMTDRPKSGGGNLPRKYFELEYFNKVFGRSKPKEILLDLTVSNASSGGGADDSVALEPRGRPLTSTSLRRNKHFTLVTKKPEFDKESKTYRLDFDGRVHLPSSSNVQLVEERDTDSVILQLGKFDNKTYSVDFQYPFNAFAAFGFAISCLSRG